MTGYELVMERLWKIMVDHQMTIERQWWLSKDNDDYLQTGSLDDYEDDLSENSWWSSN